MGNGEAFINMKCVEGNLNCAQLLSHLSFGRHGTMFKIEGRLA